MSLQPSDPSRSTIPTPDRFHHILRSLSNDYKLRLPLSDPSLAQRGRGRQARSEDEERTSAIYGRAQYLYFSDPSRLDNCLSTFRDQATDLAKHWISKPKADSDTTPRSNDPLRHRPSPQERVELQTLLLRVLDNNTGRHHRPRWSKRPSDEIPDPTSKRSKGKAQHRSDLPVEDVDYIPVRTRIGTGRPDAGDPGASVTAAAQSRSFSYANQSANTSRISFAQSVFSAPISDDCPSTQTTVAFEDDQKASQDSYPACTAEYEALNESFSKYDNVSDIVEPPFPDSPYPEPRHLEPQNPEPELPPPLPTQTFLSHVGSLKRADQQHFGSEGTTYSSIPDTAELDTLLMEVQQGPPKDPLEEQLWNIWPKFPGRGFNEAPFILLWELTRAAIHCDVDLAEWNPEYKPLDIWHDQARFRGQLFSHRLFAGKTLPHSCDSAAWKAAIGSCPVQGSGSAVIFSAELVFNPKAEEAGPLFCLRLNPPYIGPSHRLIRRFGADRFVQIIMPSPTSRDVPATVKDDEQGPERIIKWLTTKAHYFLGRRWSVFYTRGDRKNVKDPQSSKAKKTKTVVFERVHFFAIDGINFQPPPSPGFIPPPDEALQVKTRTKMRRCDLLTWALNIKKNADQPISKLFSRLALSVSSTIPTVVLEPHQFRHQTSDIGTHKVMNDGIARISRSLARKVSGYLGLADVPCAFQGRLGSAKGMWIIDVDDDGLSENDWIETFPSQRKWKCDFEDVHHRTFEVRSWPRELRTASLNQQFIPVLEGQSCDRLLMRKAIAVFLSEGLKAEMDGQLVAMNHPMDFRAWTHRAGFASGDRRHCTHAPFLGGLPERDEEVVPYLLDAGFDTETNGFLKELIWDLRKRQAERLKLKMNVSIPRSAYSYMVIDFTGTLEEGEVHFAFSSKFQANGESETLLDGVEVLVARAPAHFVSDIQKVKAVFKPRLKILKDVIVFSSKGRSPLADMLSGGDYDGDLAWVCWDPQIVQNFENAPKPPEPDLVGQGYLRKETKKFHDILRSNTDLDVACTEFMEKAVAFNMQQSMLGICTIFKEKLCYYENSVKSPRAVALSTLVGLLVDQAKQGYIFTRDDFKRLKLDMDMTSKEPEYENERSSSFVRKDGSVHILDHLRFEVANITIEEALRYFEHKIGRETIFWDKELTSLYDEFTDHAKSSRSFAKLMQKLRSDIEAVGKSWREAFSLRNQDVGASDYPEKIMELHQLWLGIMPPKELMTTKTVSNLLDSWNGDSNLSKWSLLKASTTFKHYYKASPKMVWRLAGQQLAWMKAMVSRGKTGASAIPVTAEMWSVLRPDNKRINSLAMQRALGQDSESMAAIEDLTDFDEYGAQIDDL